MKKKKLLIPVKKITAEQARKVIYDLLLFISVINY